MPSPPVRNRGPRQPPPPTTSFLLHVRWNNPCARSRYCSQSHKEGVILSPQAKNLGPLELPRHTTEILRPATTPLVVRELGHDSGSCILCNLCHLRLGMPPWPARWTQVRQLVT